MACYLISVKPLSEPMLEYCELDPKEQTSVKFLSEFTYFHTRKCNWAYCMRNGVHFVLASMCYTSHLKCIVFFSIMNRKYRIDRCLWLLLATYSICLLMCRFVELQFRRSYLIVKWKHAYFIAALYECVRGLSLLWSVRSSWCKCACWFLCKIVIRLTLHESFTHKWLDMHGCVISGMAPGAKAPGHR